MFTVPQFNFVYLNVVENLSKQFGFQDFTFYHKALKEEYSQHFEIAVIGLVLFSFKQLYQLFPSYDEFCQEYQVKPTRIPFLIIYQIAYFLVLN